MQVSVGESSTSASSKLRVPRNPAIRIRDNNVSLLQRLSTKTDLRNTDRNRLTSLSWAAVEGSLEVFEWLLLDYGHDDLELSRDSDNNTLLHLLASVPSSQPTSLPYSSLFPPLPPSHLPSPAEQSRRSIQMTGLYHTLFPFLLDWSNSGGKTPLHIAAQSGNSPFISLLLSYGADPDLTDLQGNSPLHYAAAWGHMEVARVLLEEGGAAWAIRNFEGFSAVDYAYSDEIRSGLESTWEDVKIARRERRRVEVEGDMYEGEGVPAKARPTQNGAASGIGNRWRSGSASTAASWIGSNVSGASGASGSAPSNSSGLQGDPRPAASRARSSRSGQGPPVTQYPRRASPIKGRSSPPVPDSGYATPRYDPNTQALSRSSSQSQLQTLLRTRSTNPSHTPTPAMSRQGSGQNVAGGDTSQRSSPVTSPRIPRPVLLAPQISITPQETSQARFDTPPDYRYDQPSRVSPSTARPFPPDRSPSLPNRQAADGGGSRGPTAARPTAAGPPVSTPGSAAMVPLTSSPASGLPLPTVEGIRRKNSAQVGLGLNGGRGQIGGRI